MIKNIKGTFFNSGTISTIYSFSRTPLVTRAYLYYWKHHDNHSNYPWFRQI